MAGGKNRKNKRQGRKGSDRVSGDVKNVKKEGKLDTRRKLDSLKNKKYRNQMIQIRYKS